MGISYSIKYQLEKFYALKTQMERKKYLKVKALLIYI